MIKRLIEEEIKNPYNFNLNDIKNILRQNGEIVTDENFNIIDFKYLGFKNKSWLFLVFSEDKIQDILLVSILYITFNENLKFISDWEGVPSFSSENFDESERFFKNYRLK